MALFLTTPLPPPKLFLQTSFFSPPRHLSSSSSSALKFNLYTYRKKKNPLPPLTQTLASSSKIQRIVRSPALDRHVTKQSKLRFVQKLKTLLLSKPRHFLPLSVLSKCRSYLSLPPSRSILSMIKRYPTIFNLFRPSTSLHDILAVRLTPAALALSAHESHLKTLISHSLVAKLQKLLLLSSHRSLLLSKLVHLAPDLGLPANFRSRLCNDHPGRFRTVDTSYGRALQLVAWDPALAAPIPPPPVCRNDLIIDREPKFRTLNLRKGFNLKRKHWEFLMRMREMPDVNPYESGNWPGLYTMEGEKRACAVVREVLAMTLEKRTLVDHLTHFRKEFGLSNKLRGMLVRHPEMFYVSLKGMRDSVFLVEGYDEKGRLMEKDELLGLKEKLMELVREGKMMRRDKRNGVGLLDVGNDVDDSEEEESDIDEDEEDDGFGNLFESGIEGDDWEELGDLDDGDEAFNGEFWRVKASENEEAAKLESW